jgi:mRNA interferase MazF
VKNVHPLRGEIWIVRLDPAIGSEINKTRPALVISNDEHNRLMHHLTVLPISDVGSKVYMVEVFLPAGTAHLLKDSKIRCHQIRTLDRSRFVKPVGSIPQPYWALIEKALLIHLGL